MDYHSNTICYDRMIFNKINNLKNMMYSKKKGISMMQSIYSTGIILLCYIFTISSAQTPGPLIDEEADITLEVTDSTYTGDSVLIDSVDAITKMPQLIQFVKAQYPPDLIKKGISGSVVLELLVNESGSVDSVTLIKSIHPVLDTNAIKASRQFKFTPALLGSDSIAVLLQYEYHFILKEALDSIPQIVNFSGTLLEKGTRQPLADAIVVITFPDNFQDSALPLPFDIYLSKIGSMPGQALEENHLTATTDSLGRFKFFSLPSCSLKVQAIVAGYSNFETKELITSKEELDVKYYIPKLSYSDYEIVVYGKAEEKEVSRRQLTIQEIRKIPGLGGDAVKVVQAMPGVARPSAMSGEVIVRGAPTWDSKFYLDGVVIPLLYHYGGLKSTYNSDALAGVDFLPGGFGTRYGGGIAGVIELKGKESAKDRWHGSLDMGTIDASFLVEGPITNKISLLATARRSFIGDIAEFITNKFPDRFPFTMSTFYWDYVLRTDFNFSKNNHLFLTFFGARDSLAIIASDMNLGSDEISDAQERFGMNITSNLGMAGWDLKFNDKFSNTARYSLSKIHSAWSPFGFFKSQSDGLGHYIREQLSCKFNDKLTLNGGLDIDLSIWDIDLSIIDGTGKLETSRDKDWLFSQTGAYLNLEWKIGKKLLVLPGIRYDYYSELKHDGSIVPEFWNYQEFDNSRGISGDPSLRLSTRYKINDAHTLKAAIGNYNQTPQPIGQAIHSVWGNPFLSTTKAAHFIAGHEWKITDVINSDVQFYFNNQWKIPEFPNSQDIDNNGEKQVLCHDRGRGRMFGMELMLKHLQTERFFGWISYTLSRTLRYNPDSHKWDLYDQDEINNIQFLGSWHLRKQWDLGFRLRYVTGKPTTPVIGTKYIENYAYYQPKYGEKNSDRLDPFFQLDLRADKKIVYKNWIYSIYLDLQNISWFIYKSPEFEYYNYNFKDKTTISMFPMLGVGMKAEF